jgi:integrase
MRVRLKGIHKVSKTLANGTRADYFYAWRGGPRLDGKPGDPVFIASYNRAVADLKTPPQGVVFTLIAEWRASTEYRKLSDASRRNYAAYLKLIEAEFGDMPIAALSDPRVRGEFKSWRDRMASTPRKADYCWTTLARVFAVAKDNGRIAVNPCERGGRLYEGGRAENVWTDDDIARFDAVASKELRLALLMALWTGQRQGDLLRLTWTAYNGQTIKLRQSKTGRAVEVPVGAPLRQLLSQTPRTAMTILTNTDGQPWTGDGFRSSWAAAFKRAKITTDLHFHDFRGTAITRLASVDCSIATIASVTGHSLATVTAILDRHYFSRDLGAATQGIRKLERRTETVNRLQTAKRKDDLT